ncbi:MAG: MBL fold metallo-hydrolase [Anaerolineae bacterium]|nr:MBL fold metallo-hydrolase [Anaerolineae bacterium]
MESTTVDVTFLGTGGAFSAGRRSNLALLIETGDFHMLVEAGPMIMQQLARANLQAVDIERLFVSHSHGDHALGFPMLVLNRLSHPTPLHIYTGVSTGATLKTLWNLAYPGFDPHDINLHWHELSEQDPGETKLVEGITLRTTVVPHPPGVPTLAARWDFAGGPSVTFATDTVPSAATVELAHGSDLLIHESNFSAVLQPDANLSEYFHSTAQQAGEIARRAGCPRLALVHLDSQIGEHPDVLIEEARAGTDLQVVVPEDGERIRLNNDE